MGGRVKIILGVPYCAKCGGMLTSQCYMDNIVASFETCVCPSCDTIWQVAEFPKGEVMVSEIAPEEGSPDEFTPEV